MADSDLQIKIGGAWFTKKQIQEAIFGTDEQPKVPAIPSEFLGKTVRKVKSQSSLFGKQFECNEFYSFIKRMPDVSCLMWDLTEKQYYLVSLVFPLHFPKFLVGKQFVSPYLCDRMTFSWDMSSSEMVELENSLDDSEYHVDRTPQEQMQRVCNFKFKLKHFCPAHPAFCEWYFPDFLHPSQRAYNPLEDYEYDPDGLESYFDEHPLESDYEWRQLANWSAIHEIQNDLGNSLLFPHSNPNNSTPNN